MQLQTENVILRKALEDQKAKQVNIIKMYDMKLKALHSRLGIIMRMLENET